MNGLPLGSVASNTVVDHIEAAKPLLHLVNGDLAYSDLQTNPAGAWDAWFNQNQRSTQFRPWMAAAGNHEQLTGNGPIGYDAYLTRYANPPNGVNGLAGYFYAFTVGSVRFIVLQNDDVAYQWATDSYVRGYSNGTQKRWLAATLASAHADPAVDWIVVSMHEIAMSSSVNGNGSDLGVRQEWLPLFDRYDVDLVLGGHDHDYERSYTVRGVEPGSSTSRPGRRHGDQDHRRHQGRGPLGARRWRIGPHRHLRTVDTSRGLEGHSGQDVPLRQCLRLRIADLVGGSRPRRGLRLRGL